MFWRNALSSADPVDVGARVIPIRALREVIAEEIPAAAIGGSGKAAAVTDGTQG
jgi:hypothetical protein